MSDRVSPEALYATFRYRTTQMGGKVAPWAPRWLPTLLALFIGLLIFDGEFVYDDGPSIVANPTMQADQPFETVFTTDIWGSPLDEIVRGYRPLTNLLWKALWSISPDNPQIFRIFTILFHMLATLAGIIRNDHFGMHILRRAIQQPAGTLSPSCRDPRC